MRKKKKTLAGKTHVVGLLTPTTQPWVTLFDHFFAKFCLKTRFWTQNSFLDSKLNLRGEC